MTRGIAAAIGVLLVALGALWWFGRVAPTPTPPTTALVNSLPDCYFQEEPVACAQGLLADVPLENLPTVLSGAAERIQQTTDVDCHSVMHSFGEALAVLHGTSALLPGGSACSGGYYHGVMLEMGFDRVPVTLCEELSGEDRMACWHGVGHMTVTSGEFSPAWAEQTCRQAPDLEAASICVQGISMEFTGSSLGDKPASDIVSGALAVCRGMSAPSYGECAWQVYNQVATQQPDVIAEFCDEETGDIAQGCREAVGAALGGAYLPASAVPDKAVVLCREDIVCLGRVVRVAVEFRPSSSIAEKVCGVYPSLAECSLLSRPTG